jgi:transcription-repair coupling factor (superfamily II helicase)
MAVHRTTRPLLDDIASLESVAQAARALREGRRVHARGIAGSSTALVAGAIRTITGSLVLLVCAHLDDAEESEAELADLGVKAVKLPAIEVLPGESSPAGDLLIERARAVQAVRDNAAEVVIAPIAALMQPIPDQADLDSLVRVFTTGDTIDPQKLAAWLGESGYRRTDAIEEPGDFSARGGILDVFPAAAGASPCRFEFFGDEIDRIFEIDLDTLGSDRQIESAEIAAILDEAKPTGDGRAFIELMPAGFIAVLAETAEITEQGRGYFERVSGATRVIGPPEVLSSIEKASSAVAEVAQFSAVGGTGTAIIELPFRPVPEFDEDASEAVKDLVARSSTTAVSVLCATDGDASRLAEMLGDQSDAIDIQPRYLHRGFVIDDEASPRLVVPYHELIHRFDVRRSGKRLRAGRAMDTFLDLEIGDHVVHADHGIARFAGLELFPVNRNKAGSAARLKRTGKASQTQDPVEEYLTLEFAGSSKLHVPCTQIDLVQRYVGGFSGKPSLSRIGGNKWKTQKAKAADSVRDLAGELLRVRAAREHMPGIRYPSDTTWQAEFEAAFPYEETEDQLAALAELKRDMQDAKPMDRLVCGDVGFGKTELAIRAAFKACEFGKQVAVLVPTTVLAEQHDRTFRSRFADYPFRVESLSRFKTTREINQTLAALRKGQIDVIIGTHRLISKDVRFADLGLVVIDEEQRFGVEHKDRLLQLRMTADVLTLSATPIPRTLHMSMLGLRDISSLTTPPADRRAVVTEVIPYNPIRIQRAIERELAREGQVYFVHNRVNDIRSVADDIARLAPGARIVVGHGQMEPKELEQVMLAFMRREADILVSTTIIESGIDNPTANTMIINDADRFGLADLHQLRGRVGRSKHRAYCYLLLPNERTVKEAGQKRLKAIEQYSMLGAGFRIAMRDLEIRGAGNLLGAEQSGHIAAVGYEMYCRLLEDSVRTLKQERPKGIASHVGLDLGIHGVIPRSYIPSDKRRLEAYRRLAMADSAEALDALREDLTEAYTTPPPQVQVLLELSAVRAAASALGVRGITRRGEDIVFLTPSPEDITSAFEGVAGTVRSVAPDLAQTNARGVAGEALHEVYWRPPASYLEHATLIRVLKTRLMGTG